jgi:hypothetical protein
MLLTMKPVSFQLPVASSQQPSFEEPLWKLGTGDWKLAYDSDLFFSTCTNTLIRSRGAALRTLTI